MRSTAAWRAWPTGWRRSRSRHRRTPQIGRTWLQHALRSPSGSRPPAGSTASSATARGLAEIRPRLLVVQFGGASGTLASLGDRGLAVAEALAHALALGLPALPWHGQRDRLVELGALLGLIIGSTGKLARDLSLLMQTEVGEAFEPAAAGRGGSSTMPHKRNPVAAASVLAAAVRAARPGRDLDGRDGAGARARASAAGMPNGDGAARARDPRRRRARSDGRRDRRLQGRRRLACAPTSMPPTA